MEPRTNPTVMNSPMTNRKNLERKEIRLGMIQVVGLLGLAIGCIAAAFYLGFYSGRAIVFEREISSANASIPKIPIDGVQGSDEEGEQVVSEVFAKLNEEASPNPVIVEDALSNKEQEGTGQELQPDLQSIENAPLNGVLNEKSAKGEETQLGKVLEASKTENLEVSVEKSHHDINEAGGKPVDKKVQNNHTIAENNQKNEEKRNEERGNEEKGPDIEVIGKTITVRGSGKAQGDSIGAILQGSESVKVPPSVPTVVEKIVVEKIKEQKAPTPTPVTNLHVKEVKSESPPITQPVLKQPRESDAPIKNIPNGWYAQVAAPKKMDDVNALSRNLKASGFAVVIEAAEVRGENYYRILVGPEQNKTQADILLKQLKRESYIKGEPFIRMVK